MVILVDRSTYRAQTVMTVREDVRNREFLQSRCPRRLQDADKCNIVGSQFIKLDL